MKNDYLLIILILIQLVTVCYAVHVNMNYKRLQRTYRAFMKGKDGRTLEKSIIENSQKIDALQFISEQNREEIQKLTANSKCHYQKTGIVKYDAFGEDKGALSFAITLLDENNSGWILNVVQGSSKNYSYVKEVVNGESYVDLSDEEKESLEKAVDQEMSYVNKVSDDENIEKTEELYDVLDEIDNYGEIDETDVLEEFDDLDDEEFIEEDETNNE